MMLITKLKMTTNNCKNKLARLEVKKSPTSNFDKRKIKNSIYKVVFTIEIFGWR